MLKYVPDKLKDKLRTSRTLPILFWRLKVGKLTDLAAQVDIPPGYVGTNPAIIAIGDNFLVCVRCVNYRLANDNSTSSTIVEGEDWHTVNRFYIADAALKKIRDVTGLNDQFDGVEDIRLFRENDSIIAIGSSYDQVSKKSNIRLSYLSGDVPTISRTVDCSSPFGFHSEKNWMPFSLNGQTSFVYSIDPLIILSPLDDGGQSINENFGDGDRRGAPGFRWSGSCHVSESASGWLFLIHRRKNRLFKRDTVYLSRFMAINRDSKSVSYGKPFVIKNASVQFACGLLLNKKAALLSFGYGDRLAYLATLSKSTLKPLMPRSWSSIMSSKNISI